MDNKLISWYIEEPSLLFGGNQKALDPRAGIMTFGPYYFQGQDRSSPSEIRLGIIGDGETIALTKRWLEICKSPIESTKNNLYLFPSFPGFTKDASFRSEFIVSPSLIEQIGDKEIDAVIAIPDVNKRISKGIDLFIDKIKLMAAREPQPQVIICSLPQKINEYCGITFRTRGAKRPKLTDIEKKILYAKQMGQKFLSEYNVGGTQPQIEEKAYDFRRALKARSMEYDIPIQIVRYGTLTGTQGLEDETTRAWNFCLALYYKAGGFPWRLADFDPNTCYVGISFYKEVGTLDENIRTSVAQIFTSYGEGLVLRGENIHIDEKGDRNPHLDENSSSKLLIDSINLYESQVKRKPVRIVIHKTSRYSNTELSGFNNAAKELQVNNLTMVAFGDRGIRFFRDGKYPPLRGMLTKLPDKSLIFFTHGYSPYLKTYPGFRIPKPLEILEIHGSDDITVVAKEILSLTKMNWNSAKFSTMNPITIEFSREVGEILRELPSGGRIQQQYRFYM